MTDPSGRSPVERVELDRPQLTIDADVPISGRGLFSGEPARIVLHPAPAGSGIAFSVGGTRVPVDLDHLLPQAVHTTAVGASGVEVRSIEHLLAALSLLGIGNCDIEVLEGDEVPDPNGGSCGAFSVPLRRAGIRSLTSPAEALRITEAGTFSWEDSTATYLPTAGTHLELSVTIDFPVPIGRQGARWSTDPAAAAHDVASYEQARTFLRRDLDEVWPNGNDHWTEARRSVRGLPDEPADAPLLTFRRGEWVVAPRFPAEPAWHKLVDLAGDLLLLGRPVIGRLEVDRPGHAFNHRLVHHLLGRLDPDLPLTAALH